MKPAGYSADLIPISLRTDYGKFRSVERRQAAEPGVVIQ